MRLTQNEYDLTGDYGVGYTSNGEEFYFDLEDYVKIKDICWHKNNNGYLHGVSKTGEKVYFHRLIMNFPEDHFVDHINGKTSRHDNRKSNLRIVTDQQNKMNHSTRKDSTTGISGVSWHKGKSKWIAQIGINGKLKYLGVFSDLDSAIEARKKAEEKYFMEYAPNDKVVG